MTKKNLLPAKTGDMSDWYTTLIRLADLADYGPVKGTMIFKPYGYAIWEEIQKAMDPEIKAKGVGNVYFPMFIPMSFLEKEKSHVEGFAPELAVVTHAGGEKLEEPVVIRPTSETIMYNSFAKWVQSWRDLPIMINQWGSAVRWEKRTMPFIRTSEFLWQEGHTAHATHKEALKVQRWAIEMYAKTYRDYFGIFGYIGFKSKAETFAGADTTLTYESLMPSRKVLQSCTSHDLGQNFSKAFDVKFQDSSGGDSYVWQTSWGLSTRSIGGLILAHGDDNGLRLPPRLAPTQVVVVPVKPDEDILDYCDHINSELKNHDVRALIDARDDESFGFRLNKWEVKGAPIIIKIGNQEKSDQLVTIKRRDNGEEISVSITELASRTKELLDDIQKAMLEESKAFIEANTREAKDYDEFKQIAKEFKGFIKVSWNDDPDVEAKIKAETTFKSSCRPIDWPDKAGVDFYTGEPATKQWLFAQSY